MSGKAALRAVKTHTVEFRILGPLEVADGHGAIPLDAPKQRALLGVLLLHPNEVVSSERLIDELWGEHPPATAAKLVQTYVSQLRKALGPEPIATWPPGYQLRVDADGLDAVRFRSLIADGRRLVANGELERADAVYRAALALWRGRPLADVVFESFARIEVERLEEELLGAHMDRIDCDLALGRHHLLAAELESLVSEHPFRERLRGQLILALYRSGRQADALAAYQDARRTLVDELGLEPSSELRNLEQAILRQDSALAAPTPVRERLRHSNLPAQPTTFLGRERERAEVLSLLAREEVRLLTLTGAGGSGKTRLALEAAGKVADDYPDGVCWVPLAALRDPALVFDSIAQALGTQKALAQYLADKHMLLLLDNFEHLPAAAPRVAELTAASPDLKLLITSRERLHLAGEREYLVPTLAENEAVELFRHRAHAAEPEQAVLAICRRLDCLPLAVELAAARTKLLPPDTLLARLEHRLPLLTGGPRDAPERQRTLEATIAWSHDLLTPEEQTLFARLAVFAGGCTLEAAEQICKANLDSLQALVDKNLLRREGERFTMLETIREYAAERLEEAHDGEKVRRRHAESFLDAAEAFAAEAFELLRNWPYEPASELDNVRAALQWSIGVEDSSVALRLAASSGVLFFYINPAEGRRWLDEALALGDPTGLELRAEALRMAGLLSAETGDYEAGAEYQKRSIADWQVLGDRRSIARTLVTLAQATWARTPERVTAPRELLAEALEIYEGLSDVEGTCSALHNLGHLECAAGNNGKAEILLERALSLSQNERQTAAILHSLGDFALHDQKFERAQDLYRNNLRTFMRQQDERAIAYCLAGLSAVAAGTGKPKRAGCLFGAVERIQESREATTLAFANPQYKRLLDAARISPEDVQAGRAMTLDDAVAYALEATD
jgi:predicted ATPase/DNA-binding SARP family transcriptional activator